MQPLTPLEGIWIVRGISPFLSVFRIWNERGKLVGEVTGWDAPVPISIERRNDDVVVVGAVQWSVEGYSDISFRLTGRVEGNVLDLRFPMGGFVLEVCADRSDDDGLARYLASRPRPALLPELIELPPNGLALTPPMGWSTWYAFYDKTRDADVREIADLLVAQGFRDAGYVHVNIDDGWQSERDAAGRIHSNERFPSMRALGDYLHQRGLKFGIYSSPGPATCAGYVGSLGHDELDAQTYAEWGVDYLKYDWCSAAAVYRSPGEMRAAYQKMGQALRATGRPITYSLCQAGTNDVGSWGRAVGANLWRSGWDVYNTWTSIQAIGFRDWDGKIGPGGWSDPDMLVAGIGGLELECYRTQMTLWSLLAAPLILSGDIRRMSQDVREMLLNPEVIAVDQDGAGRQGRRVSVNGDTEVWAKEIEGGVAVGLFNRGSSASSIEVPWKKLGFGSRQHVRDLWQRADLGYLDGYAANVARRGAALLLVR